MRIEQISGEHPGMSRLAIKGNFKGMHQHVMNGAQVDLNLMMPGYDQSLLAFVIGWGLDNGTRAPVYTFHRKIDYLDSLFA